MNTIWFPDLTAGSGPKYQRLIEAIRSAVHDGALAPGEKLLPVREVAWQLEVTPGTVARAYGRLTEEGLLEARVGRGTFVAESRRPVEPLAEPLINVVVEDVADFRAARVGDVGQGAVIAEAMQRAARRNARHFIDYPTEVTDLPAREAVCDWLGQDLAGRIGPQDVVLGPGAQNCVIGALMTTLRGAQPVIMTEVLTYPGVRHAARLLRAELAAVEIDAQGIRPDSLERVARQTGAQVLLTSAEVHSPTTIRTPLERRQEILRIARRYQIQIIEDDCHRVAPPSAPAYRALAPDRAWYISSLSKSVSAALRFGYAVAPEGQAPAARQVAQSSFYGLATPMLDIGTELLRSGAAAEIRTKVLDALRARVRDGVNALGQWNIRWHPDAPFLWLHMPPGWRGSLFASACEARKIRVKPADEFALPDGVAPHAARLTMNPSVPEAQFHKALADINALLEHPPLGMDL